MMQLKVKKLSEQAKLPTKGYGDAAGFDIYSTDAIFVEPRNWQRVSTGLAFEIPEGWFLLAALRSSIGCKNNVRLHNSVIDSGFRGEYTFTIFNCDEEKPFISALGDRVVQLLMLPVPAVEIEEVGELAPSERGKGGIGSTGL